MLPNGWQQALTLLLGIVPGFVYQGMRSQLRGPRPEDRELGVRIVRALAVSGFLALLYVGVLGQWLMDVITRPSFGFERDNFYHPRATAWAFIILIFVIPIICAFLVDLASTFLLFEKFTQRIYKTLRIADKMSRYDPTPTAWDYASTELHAGFVRVLTKDQTWIGGFLGEKSYLSGYPESREIFLQQAWELKEDGSFVEPVKGSQGVWIRCDDAQLVQFLEQVDDGDYAEEKPTAQIASVKLRKGKTLRVVMVADT